MNEVQDGAVKTYCTVQINVVISLALLRNILPL